MEKFICKSLPLYYFLKSNGENETTSFPNPKEPNKIVWAFEKNEKLDILLTEWTKGKKK